MNYLNIYQATLKVELFEGNLSYVNVIQCILSQPSLSQRDMPIEDSSFVALYWWGGLNRHLIAPTLAYAIFLAVLWVLRPLYNNSNTILLTIMYTYM